VLISGPPLLRQASLGSIERLGKLSERGDVEVVFHFSLIEPSVHEVTVKKGNAFDRLILRVLGLKTEKTIKEKECSDTELSPENRIDSTKAPIEVWIYRRTPCHAIESLGVATD